MFMISHLYCTYFAQTRWIFSESDMCEGNEAEILIVMGTEKIHSYMIQFREHLKEGGQKVF